MSQKCLVILLFTLFSTLLFCNNHKNFVGKRAPEKIIYYNVKSGDNLINIAKLTGEPVSYLLLNNPEIKGNKIIAGEKLRLYVSTGFYYTVRRGDSLIRVSHIYGVPVGEIKKFNEKDSNMIRIGEKLFIPQPRPLEEDYPIRYEQLVEKYSKLYKLDDYLLYSIIREESYFNPKDISGSQAYGLMQIILPTARIFDPNITKEKLLEPETNIKLGCEYLKYLFDRFGSMNLVIAAYNAGETKVRHWKSRYKHFDVFHIPFSETRRYVQKVRTSYYRYKSLYSG